MSKIRGSNNKATEMAMIAFFRRHQITKWRRNQKVFGKPDFIFWSMKVAVFVDGCFWHGCRKHGVLPSSNREFWKKKLDANKARDRRVTRKLRGEGWTVIRIWEHELGDAYDGRLHRRIMRYM
jgi:DNA mismatch endonuclease, patch repair protein